MYGGAFMFYVINTKKFLSYICVFILFLAVICVSGYYTDKVVETMANTSRLLPIYSVETDERKVALTFDCAWGADDIPDILKILDENGVKATFFLVGTWIDKYPEAVRQIAEAGHDIGNHSNSHAHVNKLSYDSNIEDMRKCNEKIEKISNKKVNLYRGPYGEYNNTVINASKAMGMEVIQWDIDTLDYTGLTPDEMCKRIKSKLRNGSIILMHNDTDYTSKGLQQIIDTIEEMEYEIVPVSELIYKGEYQINHEGRQIQRQ